MKFNLKKYLYLANDVTNMLLKNDREDSRDRVRGLRFVLIIVSIILVLSIALNIYLYLK